MPLARPVRRLVALLACLTGLLGGAAVPAPERPPRPAGSTLPGHTIVAVEGDAENGFGITRLDGGTEYPPTLSESVAECEEHDDATQVAVCVAEVRTRYAGLADVQLSLRWSQERGSRPR